MHIQSSQGKKTSGYAQANAAASQPENTPTHSKKNGSGLLSSHNAKVNNAQPPQAIFQSTSPSSIGQLPRSTQVSRTEAGKQNLYPGSPVSRGGNSHLASHAATPVPQRPAQQPPNSFVPSNPPQRPAQQPYQGMPPQTRPTTNFHTQREYAATPATAAVPTNPSNRCFPASPAAVMPN